MFSSTSIEAFAKHLLRLAVLSTLASCGLLNQSGGCDGPPIDTEKLLSIRGQVQPAGQTGYLVVPNPIDATGNTSLSASDTGTLDALKGAYLPGLTSPTRLENSFLHVRLHSTKDDLSLLARPDGSGKYLFKVDDPHYSEVMAYHSVTAMLTYVESLGFSVVKTRPLYILVRAQSDSSSQVNAYYDHEYLNPQAPRTMYLFGDTKFAPGMDQDIYWHEFGHLFNESVSRESGIDFAGDNGAVYTEGAALHECLADHLAQSVSNRGYIGRWIARNFPGYAAGAPLRSAVDTAGSRLYYSQVAANDGTGQSPERYHVAEWCTRALWQIHNRVIQDNAKAGAILSDRLIYSAVSLLSKDTSFSQFRAALLKADSKLHCGRYSSTIKDAFASRGFDEEPSMIQQPLQFQFQAVGLSSSGKSTSPTAGGTLAFAFQIGNSSSTLTAHNVRVYLESDGQGIYPTIYMQGFGDLPPGAQISVGSSGLGYDFSVQGDIDKSLQSGSRSKFTIRVKAENAPDGIFSGELKL